jgi:hypothetical protein
MGSGLLFAGAVIAVTAGPYSFQTAPVLATAVELLALVTLVLTLTGNSEWAPIPGILLLLVMTMPLAGLTLGQSFPAPLRPGDLRCWIPLYLGIGMLATSGRSPGEAASARGGAVLAGIKHRILFEIYEFCALISAILLGCRMAANL